jgi:hypothetical protein
VPEHKVCTLVNKEETRSPREVDLIDLCVVSKSLDDTILASPPSWICLSDPQKILDLLLGKMLEPHPGPSIVPQELSGGVDLQAMRLSHEESTCRSA